MSEKTNELKKYLVDPPTNKALSKELPVIPGLIPKRKTIVLELDDVLLKNEMKFGQAPELVLRPGLRKFLAEVSKHYEIVVVSKHRTDVAYFSSRMRL